VKATIRPLKSTDLQGLARLRIRVRPHSFEAYDDWPSYIWRWLEMHPLADRIHRWVLDAGGEIVGHLAALPQYYRINGQRAIAHTPAEYMVLPSYGFHAIPLMREFFRACDNCVTSDTTPAVIGVEMRLGAEEAGRLEFGAKLWHISEVPGFPTAIPGAVTQPLNWALLAVDRALNATIPVDDLKAETLNGFDATFDELFESVAAGIPCVLEKDAVFLRWRYGSGSPHALSTILGVRDGGTLLGYAVLWVAADGDSGYLLDLTTRPSRPDVARTLLCGASRHFRRLGVHSVRYRFVESPTSPRASDLWRMGFFIGRRKRPTLLVKFADSGLHKIANDTARWSYSYGDGEGSFWIR
jgi:hypothetical protein